MFLLSGCILVYVSLYCSFSGLTNQSPSLERVVVEDYSVISVNGCVQFANSSRFIYLYITLHVLCSQGRVLISKFMYF